MPATIAVQDLKIGMFIRLDLGWMSHPFPLSAFRISSGDELEIASGGAEACQRATKVRHVVYLGFLTGKVAKWWMPDDVAFVEKIPLGATGKLNKLQLRKTFQGHAWPEQAMPAR